MSATIFRQREESNSYNHRYEEVSVSNPRTANGKGQVPQSREVQPVNPEEYITCMRRFVGGVNIITSADGNAWAGLTATAVCSLSADPPRILCCVNQHGVTLNVIRNARNFCVNMLSVDHKGLAERFSGIGDISRDDRFADGLWKPLKTGAPALINAISSIDCVLESTVDSGTHSIIIGSVVATNLSEEGDPLLWLGGEFNTVHSLEK